MSEWAADGSAPTGGQKDKVCEWYLKPRGCMKGDACDFQHPPGMAGSGGPLVVKNKICEYYLKPRGCKLGTQCDFLHPDLSSNDKLMLQAQVSVKSKLCTFFGTPRGCIKGDSCDFLHSTPASEQMLGQYAMPQYGMGMPMGPPMMGGMGGMGAMGGMGGMVGGGGSFGPRPCQYFSSPGGCAKGNDCNFAHIPSAFNNGPPVQLPKKNRPCQYWGSPRGCMKGDTCDFIHEPGADGGAGKIPSRSNTSANRYNPY